MGSRPQRFVLVPYDIYISKITNTPSVPTTDEHCSGISSNASDSPSAQQPSPSSLLKSQILSNFGQKHNDSSSSAKLLSLASRFSGSSSQIPDTTTTATTSDTEAAAFPEDRRRQQAITDELLNKLLTASLSGGRVERSRHIINSLQDNPRLGIDTATHHITIDGQDTNVFLGSFLYDIQQPNKNIPNIYRPILSVLQPGEYLVANSKVKEYLAQSSRNGGQTRWISIY